MSIRVGTPPFDFEVRSDCQVIGNGFLLPSGWSMANRAPIDGCTCDECQRNRRWLELQPHADPTRARRGRPKASGQRTEDAPLDGSPDDQRPR